jgi:type III secretion protein S
MGTESVIQLMQQALGLVLWLSAPVLGVAAAVGLLWSLFQAVTQLQDQASAFVIKLVAVAVILFSLAGWMGAQVELFAARVFQQAERVNR